MKKDLSDPLNEEKYRAAPGLIHKYKKTVLWKISTSCPITCNYCFRKNTLSKENQLLNDKEIDKCLKYIEKNKNVTEVILSGGDPLFVPKKYLEYIISNLVYLQKKGNISTIRIHTRLPVTRPDLVKSWHYQLFAKIKNPYFVLHINTEEEITDNLLNITNNLRKKSNALILSQTVLLKNINDSEKKLINLFERLSREGIRPYYLHQLDKRDWNKKYEVSIKDAIKLWNNLRNQLSGIENSAKFVIDSPTGVGKIVIPEGNSWKVDYKSYKDFKGKKVNI